MKNYTYEINKRGNATITYVGTKDPERLGPIVEEHIIIPAEIDGHIVDEIADDGFTCCDVTLSIYVPKSIKVIGKGVFECCINAVIYFESEHFEVTKEMLGGDVFDVYFGVNILNFYRDDDFDYLILNDDSVMITHYNGCGGDEICIPNKIVIRGKTYNITELGNSIFENPCVWDAKKVIIPNGIKFEKEVIFNRFELAEIIIK